MSLHAFEVPSGLIDGVNTIFVLARPYVANSLAVFLNGQLKVRTYVDGWVETDPSAGILTLNEPPRTGDVVQVCYQSSSADSEVVQELVLPLRGVIDSVADLEGSIALLIELRGTLCTC